MFLISFLSHFLRHSLAMGIKYSYLFSRDGYLLIGRRRAVGLRVGIKESGAGYIPSPDTVNYFPSAKSKTKTWSSKGPTKSLKTL